MTPLGLTSLYVAPAEGMVPMASQALSPLHSCVRADHNQVQSTKAQSPKTFRHLTPIEFHVNEVPKYL